ncbi:SDR family NAD(P)-dependent oxidoreductase [Paenibacillus donghaensis]|nr:SDR family NAD(P)-dependent oxidoreductase [Paenibacillus donghaensis]
MESSEDIAIIGMDCRLPQANNVQQYWDQLIQGHDCTEIIPEKRREELGRFLKLQENSGEEGLLKQGYLEDISGFDAAFFNISPAEASTMDPIQRLFLMVVWGALEDAGVNFSKLNGSKTGVFVGKAHLNEPLYKDFIEEFDMIAFNGSATGILASRISYILNLNGPSLVVDTACSSGLVALHLACRALLNNECETAVAGGVRIMLMPLQENKLSALESPDHTLRPFDSMSNGTVWGEGITAVVLKPLSKAIRDRDHVYAVIKGSAINNDGASNGISAPNAIAQENLIADLWDRLKINPESISYIEAHGTGTPLGDPVEIKGITNAYRRYTNKKQFCPIGTVKGNLGHLVAASGLAGLIKVVLAMKHNKIPPTIHFNNPNPYINFVESPVFFNDRMLDWKSDQGPLRASVSSFGISGTNAYVIVDEYVEDSVKQSVNINKPFIFTCSAKSDAALLQYIRKYSECLGEFEDERIGDVCFTANTGRVHQDYRLAMVATGIHDLRNRLQLIIRDGLEKAWDHCAYYGNCKPVSVAMHKSEPGMVAKSAIRTHDELSVTKARSYVEGGQRDRELLDDLCQMYSEGASVPWDSLFSDSSTRKVALPTYPFECKPYWAKSNTAVLREKIQDQEHPLVGRLYLRTINQDIYVNEISPADTWVLKEHKVAGHYIMPGTAFIEMAMYVGKVHYGLQQLELMDIAVISPLMVKEGESKKIQTIVKHEDGLLNFVIAGEEADVDGTGCWFTQYVQGKIQPLVNQPETVLDAGVFSAHCTQSVGKINPNEYTKGFIEFGSRWRDCAALITGKDNAVAELHLPKEYQEDLKQYFLHPALLDLSLNALALTVDEKYLPFAYKSMKIYGPTPSTFTSYITAADNGLHSDSHGMKSYEVIMRDKTGKVFAEVNGYSIKKANLLKSDDSFHTIKWVPAEVAASSFITPKKALVLKDQLGISEDLIHQLTSQGCEVVEISVGSSYRKIDEYHYEVAAKEEDYVSLLRDAKVDGLTHIIHMASLSEEQEIQDTEGLRAVLDQGLHSLFFLTKHLVRCIRSQTLSVYLVSRNVYSITGKEHKLQPYHASFFGLGKVISNEYPILRCRCIDMGDSMTGTELAEALNHSLVGGGAVAFRDGIPYMEEIQALNLDSIPDQSIEIGGEGVYIITGGTGGIGMEICKYLASRGPVNLALISRTPLPEIERWDASILSGEERRLGKTLKQLAVLRSAGAEIVSYSADAADYEQMTFVLADLRRKFGRIRGVIHSAGVAGQGLLLDKDFHTFHSVIHPKIYGAWVLSHLTEHDELDMFVLFSSIASLVAYPGQGDYTAANAFLDAFSDYSNQRGRRMLVINWPAWGETGMAVNYNSNVDMLFKAISTQDAVQAFDKVLQKQVGRVIIGELDYGSDMIDRVPVGFSEGLKAKLRRVRLLSQKVDSSSVDVEVQGRSDGEYTATELLVSKVWGEVLGFQTINIYDSFYDLGGDSVFAMKLVNSLSKQLNMNIGIVDVFNYQTVNELSEYVDREGVNRGEGPDTNETGIIKHVEAKDFYSITAQQKGIYLHYQRLPRNTSYNTPIALDIHGHLDVELFERMIIQLIKRHEVLRTSFSMNDGMPVFRVHEEADFKMGHSEAPRQDIKEIMRNFVKPFSLEEPPLLRVETVKLGSERYLLLLDIHHILADRASVGILLNEFFQLLDHKPLSEPGMQYSDYAQWQAALYSSEKVKKSELFWLNMFKGEIPLLNLPTDFPRPSVPSYEGDSIRLVLDENLCASLYKAALEAGTTINMVLTAAFYVLLSKFTLQKDIIIGCNVLGRTHVDIQQTMGMFVNTLPIRSCIYGDQTFKDYLNEVKRISLSAYDHQNYPLESLLDKLHFTRVYNRNPLFDVCFNMMNISDRIDPAKQLSIQGLVIKTVEYVSTTSKFDMTLIAATADHKLDMVLEYKTSLYKRSTIEDFLSYYHKILQAVSCNLNLTINELSFSDQLMAVKQETDDVGDFAF